jgi:hypothetical protein
MSTRWARVLRGQVVAIISTVVAAFSHGFADGAHPPLVAVILAFAFSSVACVALASARMSRARLAASVAISQLLYHGLFSLFGPAGTPTGTVTAGHHGTITFTPGATETAMSTAGDQWMLVAHVVAALLTFAMLVKGERALLTIGALRRLIATAIAWRLPQLPAPLSFGTRFPTVRRAEFLHRSLIVTSSLTLRGPPRSARLA